MSPFDGMRRSPTTASPFGRARHGAAGTEVVVKMFRLDGDTVVPAGALSIGDRCGPVVDRNCNFCTENARGSELCADVCRRGGCATLDQFHTLSRLLIALPSADPPRRKSSAAIYCASDVRSATDTRGTAYSGADQTTAIQERLL